MKNIQFLFIQFFRENNFVSYKILRSQVGGCGAKMSWLGFRYSMYQILYRVQCTIHHRKVFVPCPFSNNGSTVISSFESRKLMQNIQCMFDSEAFDEFPVKAKVMTSSSRSYFLAWHIWSGKIVLPVKQQDPLSISKKLLTSSRDRFGEKFIRKNFKIFISNFKGHEIYPNKTDNLF